MGRAATKGAESVVPGTVKGESKTKARHNLVVSMFQNCHWRRVGPGGPPVEPHDMRCTQRYLRAGVGEPAREPLTFCPGMPVRSWHPPAAHFDACEGLEQTLVFCLFHEVCVLAGLPGVRGRCVLLEWNCEFHEFD